VKRTNIILIILTIFSINTTTVASTTTDSRWRNWSSNLFTQAKKENKFVILDLEAVWCHWCHVMRQKTYSNREVGILLDKHFISVRVDQDSRPDLANKYRDYGWPATIIFKPNGEELVKRRGYIPADTMITLLKAVAGKKIKSEKVQQILRYNPYGRLGQTLRKRLIEKHNSAYDKKRGGLNLFQKFIDLDSIEYSIVQASQGNSLAAGRLDKSLSAGNALIDPAWGGVYQYSTHSDWLHPHFEKIMSSQANSLIAYALAYSKFKNKKYLQSALNIHRYMDRFLTSPEGAFYTSQDADLKQGKHSEDYFKLPSSERIKLGIPRIDKHRYARENGWASEAYIVLYMATKNDKYLRQAKRAISWVLKNRQLPNGGFRHGKIDIGGPYLGDTLAMGNAFIRLYKATGDNKWLQYSVKAGRFITKNFKNPKAGYNSAGVSGDIIKPVQHIDENIAVTRFMIRVYRSTGNKEFENHVRHGLKYLATPEIALKRISEPGILLVDFELELARKILASTKGSR